MKANVRKKCSGNYTITNFIVFTANTASVETFWREEETAQSLHKR